MTCQKLIFTTMLLSTFSLCAFGVTSASALTLHECTEEGLGKETLQRYSDSACIVKNSEGKFHTTPIVGRHALFPTLTSTKFVGTENEPEGVHAVAHGVIGGVKYEITCTELTSPNSEVENVEEGGKMGFKGTGKTVFKGCEMKLPTACTVPAELETKESNQTTSEMSVKVTPQNEAKEFITFTIAGEKCPAALKGPKTVEGEAVGSVSEEEPQSISFNSGSGSKLTFGGQEAQFTAKIHFKTSTGQIVSAETP